MQGINGEQRKIKICDIHAHIVPGIDDGAGDMNMAIALLRLAQEQGVKHDEEYAKDILYRNAEKFLGVK